MTGVCFLTMVLHGRALVDADGAGLVSVFSEQVAQAEATNGAGSRPRGAIGRGLTPSCFFFEANVHRASRLSHGEH